MEALGGGLGLVDQQNYKHSPIRFKSSYRLISQLVMETIFLVRSFCLNRGAGGRISPSERR